MKVIHVVFQIVIITAMMTACKEDQLQSSQANNENVLGLVVPNENALQNKGKVILLKDGRMVNPISGITGFDKTSLGTKLIITFTEEKVNGKVIDAQVKKFSVANDSVFIPVKKTDPLAIPLEGNYSGKFYYAQTDSTKGNTNHSGEAHVTFTGNNYTSVPSPTGIPGGGSGLYTRTKDKIKFKDAHLVWITTKNWDFVLDGEYDYYISADSIAMWRSSKGTYIGYTLKKGK